MRLTRMGCKNDIIRHTGINRIYDVKSFLAYIAVGESHHICHAMLGEFFSVARTRGSHDEGFDKRERRDVVRT